MNRLKSGALVWRGMATVCCAVGLLVGPTEAQDSTIDRPTLKVGQAAPALKISEWVKGQPVTSFEPGRIYVISFWASWSPPSLPPIAKLNRLQRDHADQFQVIGITSERRSSLDRFLRRTAPLFDFSRSGGAPSNANDPAESYPPDAAAEVEDTASGIPNGPDVTVEPGSEEESSGTRSWSETIEFSLAMDADRQTSDAYLVAAGTPYLPTIFVVGRDGQLEWFGHPNEMDGPIAEMVTGTWDRDDFESRNAERAGLSGAMGDIEDALMRGDISAAVAACQEHQNRHPDNSQIQKLLVVLRNQFGQRSSYAGTWDRQAEASWNDPARLNQMAWSILTEVPPELRDYRIALRMATRANELTGESDAAILDTLARAHYARGNLQAAIRFQSAAVDMSSGDMTATMTATLRQYETELAAKRAASVPNQVPSVPESPVAPAPPPPDSN